MFILDSESDFSNSNIFNDNVHALAFQQVFDSDMLGLIFGRFDGQILNANQAFLDLVGYSKQDLLDGGLNWKTMTPPEFKEISMWASEQLRTKGRAPAIEKAYYRKDGTQVDVMMGSSAIRNHEFYHTMAFVIDISARKKFEKQVAQINEQLETRVVERTKDLIETNSFLDSLIEHIPNMIFVKEPKDLRFIRFNKAGEDLLGLSRQDLFGKNDFDFFPRDEAELFEKNDREVLAGNKVVDIAEEAITTKSQGVRILHTKKIPVFDGRNKMKYLIGISEDITEKKKAEQQYLNLVKEQSANRIKDEFLATLSHELRTPLNVIMGYAEMLKNYHDELTPAEIAEYVQAIYRNAVDQTNIVNDLLDVSKIISGKINLNPVDLSSAEIINAVVENSRLAANAKNVEIRLESNSDVAIYVDPTRMQQIVWNLISNAIKFTPSGGHISVRNYETNNQCVIEVSDSGIGIDPEFLPFIFDRFRQQDSSTTRQYGGLGLGLSIVHHLSEMHGGTIEALSDGKNQGSLFRVSIPVARDKKSLKKGDVLIPHHKQKLLDQVKILIIDDSADNRMLVSTMLGRFGAFTIEADSARQAREVLKTFSPDILLCDIGMPGENGTEFIEKLRRDHNATPAIALTAYARDEERDSFLAAGFQAHVAKPVSSQLMISEIRKLVPHEYN